MSFEMPPCVECEHAARCGKERLACCAYATYACSMNGRETNHRTPSAAWHAFVEDAAPPPGCPECRRASPVNRDIRAAALRALQAAPGLSTNGVANAAGVSHKSAKNALGRMRERGLVTVESYAAEGGHRVALWRLT